jgi:hypothetical protein
MKKLELLGFGFPITATLIEEGNEYGPHCLVYEGQYGCPLIEFTDSSGRRVICPSSIILSFTVPGLLDYLKLPTTEAEVARLKRWLKEVTEDESHR